MACGARRGTLRARSGLRRVVQDRPSPCARGSLATDQVFFFCVLALVFALFHMQSAPFHHPI